MPTQYITEKLIFGHSVDQFISWAVIMDNKELFKFRGLLYMASNNQSSLQHVPSVSLCFEYMTGCVLLSAETCAEHQTLPAVPKIMLAL